MRIFGLLLPILATAALIVYSTDRCDSTNYQNIAHQQSCR